MLIETHDRLLSSSSARLLVEQAPPDPAAIEEQGAAACSLCIHHLSGRTGGSWCWSEVSRTICPGSTNAYLCSSSLILSSGHEANISLVRLPEALRRGLSGGSDIQGEREGRDTSRHTAHCPHTTTGRRRERDWERACYFPWIFPHLK